MAINCDTNELQHLAKCFQCLSGATLKQVQTYLLCQIANNGASGGTSVLTDGHIFVGNAANVATDVAMSKDATISDTGAVTLANNATARSDIGLGTTDSVSFNDVSAKFFKETVVAIPAANIDWSAGGMFTKALAANIVFTFSNLVAGRAIKVEITGDAASTVTWPAVRWPGGVAPVQTLSKVDVYTFITFDGVNVDGTSVQNMS